LKQDIKLNQLAITKTREDMSAMECRLKQEISDVRTELKEDMHSMENRLTEKIEGNNTRLKDHDKRISVLEEKII